MIKPYSLLRVKIVPIEVLNSLQDTLANIGAKYAKLIEPMLGAVSAISEGISKISNSSTLNMAKDSLSVKDLLVSCLLFLLKEH